MIAGRWKSVKIAGGYIQNSDLMKKNIANYFNKPITPTNNHKSQDELKRFILSKDEEFVGETPNKKIENYYYILGLIKN